MAQLNVGYHQLEGVQLPELTQRRAPRPFRDMQSMLYLVVKLRCHPPPAQGRLSNCQNR